MKGSASKIRLKPSDYSNSVLSKIVLKELRNSMANKLNSDYKIRNKFNKNQQVKWKSKMTLEKMKQINRSLNNSIKKT